jgi:4-diphosphocytidyl-2-C-methyl-D-erythritol kinase
MQLRANCKINIGLNVLRRRTDGYHDLATVMIPVRQLYDELTLERSDATRLIERGLHIDCPAEENICIKAWQLMHDRYGVGGVVIDLEKRVPFGAGLGGGSADATAVLCGIDALYELHLSEAELIACAASIGSDTAFFVRNTPQLCSGRGEVMQPVSPHIEGLTLLLIKPDEKVSTREAYAGVHPALPHRPLSELIEQPVEQWQQSIVNDFEPHIFAGHPVLARLKQSLLDQGALYAAMSGSGSTLFGLFARAEQAKNYIPPYDGMFIHSERL